MSVSVEVVLGGGGKVRCTRSRSVALLRAANTSLFMRRSTSWLLSFQSLVHRLIYAVVGTGHSFRWNFRCSSRHVTGRVIIIRHARTSRFYIVIDLVASKSVTLQREDWCWAVSIANISS